jgi:Protein of unknown function (DUF1329)
MKFTRFAVAIVVLALCPPLRAQVTASEAQALKSALTPMGAERAGNAAGTIPAWADQAPAVPEGYVNGAPRPDPFAADKPLFTITAANVGAYADQLPEGAKAMFARHAGYRMDVYPTRRSATAPSWVYENVFRNAMRAKPVPDGLAFGVEGAVGGIPFPIPKSGLEVVWNHLLAFWGTSREAYLSTYVVSSAGDIDLGVASREVADFPYYDPKATPDSFGPYYFKTRRIQDAPAAKFGEAYLAWQPINIARNKFAAWRYVPGEGRVRRAPSLSYDTPDPDASGFQTLDEYYVFFGGPDRYDWTLLGKSEMIVPYNNNRLHGLPAREVLGPAHAKPDALRYELHRVWVVEAKLAKGKSHIVPRRRLYIDEDTWFALYSDSWDEDGKLWKFGHGTMYNVPDLPAVILGSHFSYDLIQGGYVYAFAFGDSGPHYKITPPPPEAALSPQALTVQTGR